MFSSNFISLESSGYLIFIGSDFARYGATVVKISCLEGRGRSVGNFVTFFFKTFVSSNLWQISSSLFYER